MDGFAIATDNETNRYRIVGAAYAGHPFPGELQPGEAVRITTGAPLPDSADTVIPVEDTSEADGEMTLQQPVRKGQFVRYRGQEYRADEILLDLGTRLTAGPIGLLASAGIERVEVIPRPRVAIFSTGDELVELGQEPGPGQIINSNLQYLTTRLRECGFEPVPLGIGEDRSENLEQLIDQALQADMLISTGGVSVGEKDLMQQTLVRLGFQKKFWRVAIKPGKPVLFGTLEGKPCFGLPGHPAATAATFELFALPALQTLAGQPTPQPATRTATLNQPVKGGGKRQLFLWCRCEWREGAYRIDTPDRQDSGQCRSIADNNALLNLPLDSPGLKKGEQAEVILLRS